MMSKRRRVRYSRLVATDETRLTDRGGDLSTVIIAKVYRVFAVALSLPTVPLADPSYRITFVSKHARREG
jgi:hypothetical protein